MKKPNSSARKQRKMVENFSLEPRLYSVLIMDNGQIEKKKEKMGIEPLYSNTDSNTWKSQTIVDSSYWSKSRKGGKQQRFEFI